MTWASILTGLAFERWLISVASGDRISQGKPLDPFATSMRVFAPVSAWLSNVERGEPLPQRGGGGGQAAVDLRAAGLIVTDGDVALTDLGRDCLIGWRNLGVDNDHEDDEIVRSAVAVAAGVRLGVPRYLEAYRFWRELAGRYDPDELLRAPNWLYLVSYLNRDAAGYNPWNALGAQPFPALPDFETEWGALVGSLRDPAAADAANNLKTRVDTFAARPFGRVVFCMAMESYRLGVDGQFGELARRLAGWRLPRG